MAAAFVFGLLEGISAALPLPALGHQRLLAAFTGWIPSDPLALQLGVLLGLALFLSGDWFQIVTQAAGRDWGRDPELRRNPDFLWLILAAALPSLLAWYWLSPLVSPLASNPVAVGSITLGAGLALELSSRKTRKKSIVHLSLADALLAGFAQILALIPGVPVLIPSLAICLSRNYDLATSLDFAWLSLSPLLLVRATVDILRAWPLDWPPASWVTLAASAIASLCALIAFSSWNASAKISILARYSAAFGIIVVALAFLLRPIGG